MDDTGWLGHSYDQLRHEVNVAVTRPRAGQRPTVPVKLYESSRPPRVWCLWLQAFACSPGLASRLWKVLLAHHRDSELGALVRAGRRADTASVAALLQVMTPRRMLELCALLSPEGQVRDATVVELERAILTAARSPTVWR